MLLASFLSISDVGPYVIGERDHFEEKVCKRLDGYTGSKWDKENVESSSQGCYPPTWRRGGGGWNTIQLLL